MLYVMYVCWCYVQGLNFVTDPEGKMFCFTNSILWLNGGVQTEQEKELEQIEEELFDLVGQIMALVQTAKHSPEEELRLAALWEWEDQLMTRAEDLWKRITKAWKGIGIPESAPRVLSGRMLKRWGNARLRAERRYHCHLLSHP